MAPLPLPLLLALAGLAVAAAQPFFPPPQQQSTDASDGKSALPLSLPNWKERHRILESDRDPAGALQLDGAGLSHNDVLPMQIAVDIVITKMIRDLSNNNLSGSIPPEVANLSKLETWWMFDNYIEGLFPEFIANFTNLTDLRIYGMKLQGPIPKQFSNLINLKYLMLGDLDGANSTIDFIPDSANLSILDLRSNNLSGQLQLLLPYKSSRYLYAGDNDFSGRLPAEFVQPSLALDEGLMVVVMTSLVKMMYQQPLFDKWALKFWYLLSFGSVAALAQWDISYNPFINGLLPNNPTDRKLSLNYIGTAIDTSRAINSENLTLLNCLHMKECNRKYYTNAITSFAVNCGGKQTIYSDPLPITFDDDTTDLGAAGFHVNTSMQWVVSHVGSDPFRESPRFVNTSQVILGTDMPELYQTARTSRSALWYYIVGLSTGKYTVQLFFAEIVIEKPGKRLFNIDIQDRNIKTDFDITKEAGGFRRPTNITYEVTVVNSVLKIHLHWNGRGTCCIPYEGAYGPLVSAIRVFRPESPNNSPPPARPVSAPSNDDKRRGVVAGIAALCIAAAVISSSVVYLWWKWVALFRPL
uniref:non-specific serine/threonine protein kinase n=1 Tax=Aegilops tauschii TaxID=37682 RepID=M8BQ20_AEGTA